jgi:SAM-dependent methyltransferase
MYVYSFIWSKRANISMKFMQYSLVCFSQAGYLIGNETTGRTVVVDLRRDIDEDAAPQALTLDETDAEFASATMPSMESSGELGYFDALTDDGLRHALNKPWSDPDRGRMLQQLGALMSLLPPPPARVLDLGCGTGWLSWILQSSGYHVTGVDIAPRAVELAQAYVAQMAMPDHIEVGVPVFLASPADALPFDAEFDAAIFFDSLHHVPDERSAITAVARALKPGGVLLTSEPGRGHAAASAAVVEKFGVTERDMPVGRIRKAGEAAGLVHVATLSRADELGSHLYGWLGKPLTLRSWLLNRSPLRIVKQFITSEVRRLDNGIVVMRRPEA